MKNYKKYFILTFFIFTAACGVKLPPEPLYPTSPSNIDKEVTKRKKEIENQTNNKLKNNTHQLKSKEK